MSDCTIRGGRIIDPANAIDIVADIAITDGKISAIGQNLPEGKEEVDAKGCIVCPGLIDIHAHVYEYATVLGVNPDATCLARGVTTVVDGGSAGAMTVKGLKKYVCEKSETRVLAFLHIACHGLAGAGCSGPDFGEGGESDHLNAIKVALCCDSIERNRDFIVGVKVRLDKNITDRGRTEHELLIRALEASRRCQVPLMVHHSNSSIPLGSSGDNASLSAPNGLKPGDIYTHCFSRNAGPDASTIYSNESKRLYNGVTSARSKGVLFDVGHGQGSFDWVISERAAKLGFWPDTISTDLHSGNVNGAAKDLPHVMSKFLHLGMPIEKIIESVTSNAAKAIRREKEIGSLGLDRCADVSVLKIIKADEKVEDCAGEVRKLKKKIVPVAVWRAGKKYQIS